MLAGKCKLKLRTGKSLVDFEFMKTVFKYLVLLAAAAGLLVLSGCNTMEGFGKDLQKVGNEIEEAADK